MAKKYTLKRIKKTGFKPKTDETRFSINYENQLNSAQFEAVSSVEGSYLLIAGAGTGKTRTLVYRVSRLIELGYDPKSILLLTFTRKASREMMNRAALLLDNRCSKIQGGTFHSFANITLRKYAKAVGIDSNFTILDQSDSEDVINLIRSQLNLAKLKKRFPNKKTIFRILSLHVNTGKKIQEIIEEEYPHFESFSEQIHKIFKIYSEYKSKNFLLDYDDLLVYLRNFLQELSPAAKKFLSEIKFIMVDEYQDTNKLQAEIIEALAQINKNVMVVGDDSQSIYSFRGADFKNIIDFPKIFPNTKIILLEENYRSTQPILEMTNQIIEAAIEKYPKELYSKKLGGELPAIVSTNNENMQSQFIVDRILGLREEGISLNDISVLFRSSYFSFDLEIELNRANIPYLKIGGIQFIETAHVKDVLAFLRIAANPKDVISWYRVLLLHEGIGPVKAQRILEQIMSGEINIKNHPETYYKNDSKFNIYNLLETIHKLHIKKELPSDKAEIALQYYKPLFKDKYDDHNKRKKDLEIFQNITENYFSLDSLLSDMALEPPTESVNEVSEEDKEDEVLTLSTIHSAKGLEWHSVFVIHAMEGFFPSPQSVENIDALEEERRLMYVACTRAKQNLFVTYPMNIFDRYNGTTFSKPSRFISTLGENLVEQWLLEEDI